MGSKLSLEEFIRRSREVHNDFYDYSKTVYYGTDKKVLVVCPIHGEFEQKADSHIDGRGCRLCGKIICGGSRRHSVDEFIQKVKDRHGNKFNYDKIKEYTNLNAKYEIQCNFCGHFFWSTGARHLNVSEYISCPNCRYDEELDIKHKETFIEKSKNKYGNKFSYEKTNTDRQKTYYNQKVIITCSTHGDIEITPDVHLTGNYGCKKCGNEARIEKNRAYQNSIYNKTKGIINSKLEKQANDILTNLGIEFTREWSTEDCKFRNKVPYDFSIFSSKESVYPKYIIECHGKQHYFPVKFFGGEARFKIQKIIDEIKRQFCKDNNIRYLEIPYTAKSNEMEKIIKDFLFLTI